MFEFIVSLFLLVAIWYLAQVVTYYLAKLNLFWMIPEEGYGHPIYKNGVLTKVILGYAGHRFAEKLPNTPDEVTDNLDWWDIVHAPNADATPHPAAWLLDILFPIKGIVWVGIPGFCEIGKKISVKARVLELPFKDAELSNAIPYNIRGRVTLLVTNPAKALARVDNFQETCLQHVHDWLELEFRTLEEKDFRATAATGNLDAAIEHVLHLAEDLEALYGVAISIIEVGDIDPADENMRNITLKKTIAEAEAAAAIAAEKGKSEVALKQAETEASVIETIATAKAKAMEIEDKTAVGLSKNTMLIKGYEALKGANVTLVAHDLDLPTMLLPTQKGA